MGAATARSKAPRKPADPDQSPPPPDTPTRTRDPAIHLPPPPTRPGDPPRPHPGTPPLSLRPGNAAQTPTPARGPPDPLTRWGIRNAGPEAPRSTVLEPPKPPTAPHGLSGPRRPGTSVRLPPTLSLKSPGSPLKPPRRCRRPGSHAARLASPREAARPRAAPRSPGAAPARSAGLPT
jgi:hypothetical protein